MSTPRRHLATAQLAGLVEGQISAAKRERSLAHLAVCDRCRASMAWLERTIGLMRTDAAEDAPPSVVARAVRLFPLPAAPAAPTLGQRLVAMLRFDSAQTPLALGMRAGLPWARQVLYNIDDHDLDLRLTPSGSHWTVAGQVLGPGEGGRVELELEGGAMRVSAELNDLSEFTLPPLPPGRYTLRLHIPAGDVEIPALDVGPADGSS